MPKSTVAVNFNEAADIAVNLTSKIAFHGEITIDDLTKMSNFLIGQVLDLRSRIDIGLSDQIVDVVLTDAIKQRKRIKNRFLAGKVDACNTCHKFLNLSGSALALLVLSIDANHANNSGSLDDLALIAHLFNAGSNFHLFRLLVLFVF